MYELVSLNERFSIIQLPANYEGPLPVPMGKFFSITHTDEEISIVTTTTADLSSEKRSDGWRGFKVNGHLDFTMVGLLYKISKPLKENDISIFVVSTYNTDYIFVKSPDHEKAWLTLASAGFSVRMAQ